MDGVRGAINFRQIPGANIYALGQRTLEAIGEVIRRVKMAHPQAHQIIWVTLREEPIVYINGAPYCLRRETSSLRNIKGNVIVLGFLACANNVTDYSGISASRLETIEERLRDDVIAELNAFEGR